MPKVTFLPSKVFAELPPGGTILDAARKAGIVVEAPCNGTGKCGKCKVTLPGAHPGVTILGRYGLTPEEEGAGIVLACQTQVLEGDVLVELTGGQTEESVRVLETGTSIATEINPFVRKEFSLPRQETTVYGGPRVIAVEEGDTTDALYGVVIDIGTTTLVATLVDVTSGREIESASALNPQSLHGQDVLSRIKLASGKEGLALLYGLITAEIDHMIEDLTARTGVSRRHIYELVYSGNTCMLHLATNTDPSPLGRYPYTPNLRGGNRLLIKGDGVFRIADCASIYLPPIISGFIGADITSGVLATRLHERKGITLFIDIGTNGEMVIADNGRLVASSTAAGPAFEGMNITFGMRAGSGAIESFEVNGSNDPLIGIIGQSAAKGICGSGLLDVVGELVTHRLIDGSGRLGRTDHGASQSPLRERLVLVGGKPVFHLTDAVYLSQNDIRQVQLAKGAIRTGIEYLLRATGVSPAEVNEVLIAGAFGYHLREKNLLAIGLLPEAFRGKISFVGNTSRTGGVAFLLNKAYREGIERVTKTVETIELANYKDFDRTFVNFLRF
ncbi:MAG: ASKHA domain-containing protein [Syntrophorhabdales bacterium]|jgi:uncharacterized 2Fe-2S/4Fe-4S cluster protein (DUF4445 family)